MKLFGPENLFMRAKQPQKVSQEIDFWLENFEWLKRFPATFIVEHEQIP